MTQENLIQESRDYAQLIEGAKPIDHIFLSGGFQAGYKKAIKALADHINSQLLHSPRTGMDPALPHNAQLLSILDPFKELITGPEVGK